MPKLKPSICFYRNIRFLRLAHKFSTRDMAKKIEISRAHVHCLERGKRSPTLEMVVRYSKVFKVSISDLVEQLMTNA